MVFDPPPAPNESNFRSLESARHEIITRIGVLAEIHLMALRNVVDEDAFNSLADFPVELINNTVNGYQRFLSDIGTSGQNTGSVVAGMILRFKSALIYEFGFKIINDLKDEVFIGMTDQQYTEAFGQPNSLSLWDVANPKLKNTQIQRSYDLISVWLFINHAKWLVVRVGAAIEENTK